MAFRLLSFLAKALVCEKTLEARGRPRGTPGLGPLADFRAEQGLLKTGAQGHRTWVATFADSTFEVASASADGRYPWTT
jgi:hypothetical protein